MKTLLSNGLNRLLALGGLRLMRTEAGIWDLDAEFMRIYAQIRSRTLVKVDRSYALYQYAKQAARSPTGDVAQLGVYKGGTAKMIAGCFAGTEKTVYLFDTFTGLPPASSVDAMPAEAAQFDDVGLEDVQAYFAQSPHVQLRPGLFPDTAIGLEGKKFCFVYLDADLYSSTKDGLSFFYPRLTSGGVLLVDDFGSRYWPGVTQAVNEFCAAENLVPIKSAWWQALLIKRT